MKERIRRLLTELTSLNAVAGFEKEAVLYLRNKVRNYADRVEIDDFGNITALRNGSSGKPAMMLAGHMDEIGLMVGRIEKNGFLRFVDVGYPNHITLCGRNVRVNGKYSGVIGAKTWQLMLSEEKGKLPRREDLYIDVGAKNDKEVSKMGIQIGSPIALVNGLTQLGNGERYAGKALDNRVGCLLILLFFEVVSSIDLVASVWGCFTVQEEVGLRGARISANRIKPDLAIGLDVAHAQDTPDMPEPSETSLSVGKGPVIHIKEFMPDLAIGAIHHPAFVEYIEKIAKKNKIPYQRGVVIGGATDASVIHLTGEGVPSSYIGPATRYLHSQVETVDLNDIQHTVDLLTEVAKSLTPETTFKMLF